MLLVPNDPGAFGALDKSLGHYRRYTPEGLATTLAENGFELEQMLRFNRISWPAWKFTGQAREAKTISRGLLANLRSSGVAVAQNRLEASLARDIPDRDRAT